MELSVQHLFEYPHLMEEHLSETLSLRYWPNPVLSEVCDPVEDHEFGNEIVKIGSQMISLVDRLDGAGLSAPQVGLLKRLFVMRFLNKTSDPQPPAIICNPVLHAETEGEFGSEGCLSMPGVFQQVWRSTEVHMEYQTPFGEKREMVLLGIEARIVAHETDHLDGITFFHPSRMPRQLRKQVEREWSKMGPAYTARSLKRLA